MADSDMTEDEFDALAAAGEPVVVVGRDATLWPYCQHPECHSSRTSDYGLGGVTGTSQTTNWTPDRLAYLGSSPLLLPGFRRWCKAHAWLFEGWCVG